MVKNKMAAAYPSHSPDLAPYFITFPKMKLMVKAKRFNDGLQIQQVLNGITKNSSRRASSEGRITGLHVLICKGSMSKGT
jgi:hypothetical protein